MSATLTRTALPAPSTRTGVLTSGCEGYPAGTTGAVFGTRDGCVVFAPHRPEAVARWASPRAAILVPPALIVTR